MASPFEGMAKLNERAGRRRERRAMTEAEWTQLLDVTCRRPLLDRMTIRRGKNKGRPIAKLREPTKARLEKLGRERALMYKTFLLTGRRKKELASLSAGQLELDDGPVAYAVLDAADEKNRSGSEIPLRNDLAAELREWLAGKLEILQEDARRRGGRYRRGCRPIPRSSTFRPVWCESWTGT